MTWGAINSEYELEMTHLDRMVRVASFEAQAAKAHHRKVMSEAREVVQASLPARRKARR